MSEHTTTWTMVRAFMLRQCGVALGADQEYLLAARLEPVVKAQRFASLGDYVQAACRADAPPGLAGSLVDAMTTHETSFFRDRTFWSALQASVLPALGASDDRAPLRIWSAACSTGQEAYSLAMLLEEAYPRLAARSSIYATDVSDAVLETARAGYYSVMEVNRGVTAPRLARHFEPDRGGFRVKPALRQRVRWVRHNLLTTPAVTGCDLVLCRNVLIYFSDPDRKAALARLWSAASPRGFVAVGSTEILPNEQVAGGWYRTSAPTREGHAP